MRELPQGNPAVTPDKSFYQSLPKKRMGAGCLFFNELGQVMLVKPTYKPTWEIPGGIVEANESPMQCCQREIAEELGINQKFEYLLVVDYNSETDRRTESLMFIFNGGKLTQAEIDAIQLDGNEIGGFRFFDPASLPVDMTDALRNRVLLAWRQTDRGGAVYSENQKVDGG